MPIFYFFRDNNFPDKVSVIPEEQQTASRRID